MSTKIISRIIYDDNTGIPFLEDIRGNLHMATAWFQALPKPQIRYYMQTLSHLPFPNTTDFHSIPNQLTGENESEYIVPDGKTWYPAFIMAAQDRLNKKASFDMSIIGVYVNGIFTMTLPFRNEMHYILYEPLTLPAGVKAELKLMPCYENTRVCILVGGELRDIS